MPAVAEVDVDEAVALAHFSGGGRDQVDGSPGGVAPEFNAVQSDRVAHRFNVVAQVLDAVVVDDLAGGRWSVMGAESVLHDEERDAVAVVEVVQGKAQAQRVDDPAPVGGLEVGVARTAEEAVLVGVRLV